MKTLVSILAIATLSACTTTEIATLRADGKAIVAVAKASALKVILDSITRAIENAGK